MRFPGKLDKDNLVTVLMIIYKWHVLLAELYIEMYRLDL